MADRTPYERFSAWLAERRTWSTLEIGTLAAFVTFITACIFVNETQ